MENCLKNDLINGLHTTKSKNGIFSLKENSHIQRAIKKINDQDNYHILSILWMKLSPARSKNIRLN